MLITRPDGKDRCVRGGAGGKRGKAALGARRDTRAVSANHGGTHITPLTIYLDNLTIQGKITRKKDVLTKKQKAAKLKYQREYNRRPGVKRRLAGPLAKARKKKAMIKYLARPEVQKRHAAYMRIYNARPSVKRRALKLARIRRADPKTRKQITKYMREYMQRPAVIRRVKKYNAMPAVRRRNAAYQRRPDVKKRRALTSKKYYKEHIKKIKITRKAYYARPAVKKRLQKYNKKYYIAHRKTILARANKNMRVGLPAKPPAPAYRIRARGSTY